MFRLFEFDAEGVGTSEGRTVVNERRSPLNSPDTSGRYHVSPQISRSHVKSDPREILAQARAFEPRRAV